MTTTEPLNFPYIRVSTADQENSLQVQELRIRQYADFKNMPLQPFIIDEDISGGKKLFDRPAGASLKNIPPGSSIIAINLFRIFRNTIDALVTADKWNSSDISIHIIDMGGASFNTKTAIGRLIFTQIVSMGEFERNITGERTKAVLSYKKDKQKVYCRPLLGFDNINGSLVPNLKELEIIYTIQDLSSSMSHTQIAQYLNDANHRTKNGFLFRDTTIKSILKNKIYKKTEAA